MKIHGITIDFKPEFGNINHIRICEMIAEVNHKDTTENKRYELLEQVRKEVNAIKQ